MWFYTSYFFYIYLLIFDGIPCATTTLALPHQSRDAVSKESHLNTPKPTISVDPRDIWDEVKEVTEGSINVDTKDNTPKNLFQPTSFLNPGYGVLFEHIGQLHQSVYKHYLIIALKIPTLHNMPHKPEQWYKGCEESKQTLIHSYENLIFKSVFNEDYCAQTLPGFYILTFLHYFPTKKFLMQISSSLTALSSQCPRIFTILKIPIKLTTD